MSSKASCNCEPSTRRRARSETLFRSIDKTWFLVHVAVVMYAAPRRVIGQGQNLVCEVMTPVDQPLQYLLGIECNVTKYECNCTWNVLLDTNWLPLTKTLNASLDELPRGYWYVSDPSGQCVALAPRGKIPSELKPYLPCPPGFYCQGGRDSKTGAFRPPLSCHKGDYCPGRSGRQRCPVGHFCPFPAAPLQPCPSGGVCPEGSTSPQGCEIGGYCSNGQWTRCEEGMYCPYGSVKPRPCTKLFAICPPGSHVENTLILSGLVLVLCYALSSFGALWYRSLVQHGWITVLLALVATAGAWLLDPPIGGFLSLQYVAVAANWALLKIGTCNPWVAKILMVATLFAGLSALWWVNPPWALLISGLAFCAHLGWLMSRESLFLVLCGRALMFLSAIGLFIVCSQVDQVFTLCLLMLVFATIVFMLSIWICQQQQRHRRRALPFVTSWRRESGLLTFDARAHEAASQSRRRLFGSRSTTQDTSSATKTPDPASSLVRDAYAPWREMFSDAVDDRGSDRGGSSGDVLGVHCLDLPPLPPQVGVAQAPPSPTPVVIETERPSVKAGVSFRLQDLSFELPDGKAILNKISLHIKPGTRVAVMGPSGSGKSTLLAVLSGRASYGRVDGTLRIGGWPADDLRFLKNVTGFVPQDDVLHGELTVEDNIHFQASLRLPAETSAEQVQANVLRVAQDLNLSALLKERVGTPDLRGVSGGQRKRVSIAMELVSQPSLLFADEPTSGLDSTMSHEAINCLNGAAARLGTTVLTVIHQPRYDTLCLFDDLVLLGVGGCLVYFGDVRDAKNHFERYLSIDFPPNSNPADVFLDSIQPPHSPEACAEVWRTCQRQPSLTPPRGGRASRSLRDIDENEDDTPVSRHHFIRRRRPFFIAVLTYMDRAMLQSLCAWETHIINQTLSVGTTFILCTILSYERLDQFMMQSAFAALFLMLLQGVAAHRIFGADLLITVREARVGMPMVAYFVAKDLAAMFEVTISAAVFSAAYSAWSGAMVEMKVLFAGAWAFVYAVFGLSYIFSIMLSPGAAQMSAVVSSFISFCVAGVYQPQLPAIAAMLDGRGWMIPAMSPVRWFWGYLLASEVPHLTSLTREAAGWTLMSKGYDPKYLSECSRSVLGFQDSPVATLAEAWRDNRAWVCSTAPLLLLGVILRFLAGVALVFYVNAQTSGWARFLGKSASSHGGRSSRVWKLLGNLFRLLMGTFLLLFLFAEVYVMGVLKLEGPELPHPKRLGQPSRDWNASVAAVLVGSIGSLTDTGTVPPLLAAGYFQ